MKYTVSINEKAKEIKVNLNGYEGVAKCCPTDSFNITTGIELALERAKVAKANAETKATPKSNDVMALVKALEKALPKGEMVIVGNGDYMTDKHKAWLRSLAGGCTKCECGEGDYYTDEEIDDIKDEAHAEGYDEGYDDAMNEYEEDIVDENDIERILDRIREVLADELDV